MLYVKLVIPAIMLAIVNIPVSMMTTKRVSVLFLLSALLFLSGKRFVYSFDSTLVLLFYSLMVFLSLFTFDLDHIAYQRQAVMFTWIIIFISYICFSFYKPMRDDWLPPLVLTLIFLFIVSIVHLSNHVGFISLLSSDFRYLLKSSEIPINSTFNQLVMLVMWMFFSTIFIKNIFLKYFIFSLVLFLLYLIVFSLSRQNILIIFVFFSSYFFLGLSYLAFLKYLVFLSPFIWFGWYFDAFNSIFNRFDKSIEQLGSGDYSRLNQFYDSFSIGLERPFNGLGFGGFYRYAESLGYYEHTRVPESAYNQIVSEFGVIFFVLFSLFWLWLFIRFAKAYFVSSLSHEVSKFALCYFIALSLGMLFNEWHFTSSLWVSILFLLKCMEMEKYNGLRTI